MTEGAVVFGWINIVGAENTISWKKSKSGDKPAVTTVGTGNKVDQAK